MSGQLQSRLIGIMRSEVESLTLQLSPYCTQQIESLINQGMVRMRYNRALESPGHVMQAESNMRSLISYLADFAREAGTFPALNNSDFDEALLVSPNYWPFCGSG